MDNPEQNGQLVTLPPMPKVVDTSLAEKVIKEALLGGEDVFLTGGAGVGKTYLTNLLLKRPKRKKEDAWNFDAISYLSAVRLATTAIAASHIKGVTIHRFFKLGLSHDLRSLKEWDKRQAEQFGQRIGVTPEAAHKLLMGTITKNLVQNNVIVIEEISMASMWMIEMIYYRLRECLGAKIPILFVGDFFQLPPVTKVGPVRYAFDSPYWNPRVFELTKVQRTDNIEFAEVLNKIRVGTKDKQVIEFFGKLGMRAYDPNSLHLFATNVEIDNYNIDRLSLLEGKGMRAKYRFNDTEYKEGDVLKFIENELIINPIFYFKYGARVIMTSNQYDAEGDIVWFNGESGILEEYVENYFIVKKDNGTRVHVKRESYQRIEMKDGREKVLLECHHFPLRVGYAISIHKSQGMSLGQGHVDCTQFFLPEQPYVAFSRFTDPDTLSVSNFNPDLIRVNKRVLAYYESADITILS